MTDRELMQQALDALETVFMPFHDAVIALRDRLAQPEQELVIDCPRCGHCCPKSNQEPVAWYDKHGMVTHDPFEGIRPLYAASRQWVGLTDEDIFSVLTNLQEMYNRPPTTDSSILFAYAIEDKLRERNT